MVLGASVSILTEQHLVYQAPRRLLKGVFILGLEIKRSNEQYLLIIVLKDNNCLRREA